MDKKIAVERLFSLGDFKNIKFSDEISNIPDEVASNPEAAKLLRYLQLIEIEYAYNRYMLLVEKLYTSKLPLDEILEELEKERTITFENLVKAIYTPAEKHAEMLLEADKETIDIKSGD